MGLAFMSLHSAAHAAKGQADSVCPGFVVLRNGYAVWIEESDAVPASQGHEHGGQQMHKMENKGHEHGGQQMHKMGSKGHEHGDDKGQVVANHKHLMGYQHGQAIVAGKDGLCVPNSSSDDTAWMGVSQDDALSVAVESLRGVLAHNSRANEGFGITVVEPGGTRLENANLQLFVRMPQHDQRMPGGHGPANDPDVKGLAAMPEGRGRYRINTVDFSMPGPWLLEVVVTNGGDTFKAYFAPEVGEE
jgi:hypothetical protein